MLDTPYTPPRRTRWDRLRDLKRRRELIAIAVVLVLFIVALLLWAGSLVGGGTPSSLPADPGTISASPSPSSASPSGTPSPSASDSGLPALPGFGSAATVSGGSGVNSTDLNAFGLGKHTVVLTATADHNMLAVAFAVKGEKQGNIYYNVKSPVTITRTLSGGRPFGAIAIQQSPEGGSATCTVSIDGKVVYSNSTHKPYAVMGCVG